jgi:hypothetical protein
MESLLTGFAIVASAFYGIFIIWMFIDALVRSKYLWAFGIFVINVISIWYYFSVYWKAQTQKKQ